MVALPPVRISGGRVAKTKKTKVQGFFCGEEGLEVLHFGIFYFILLFFIVF